MSPASQKFQYAQGTTYEFDYTADTSTGMEDASEDTARLSVTATALVHVISDCDMVLQVRPRCWSTVILVLKVNYSKQQ